MNDKKTNFRVTFVCELVIWLLECLDLYDRSE